MSTCGMDLFGKAELMGPAAVFPSIRSIHMLSSWHFSQPQAAADFVTYQPPLPHSMFLPLAIVLLLVGFAASSYFCVTPR